MKHIVLIEKGKVYIIFTSGAIGERWDHLPKYNEYALFYFLDYYLEQYNTILHDWNEMQLKVKL